MFVTFAPDFIEKLKTLKFITLETGIRESPQNLFDPDVFKLKDVFEGEEKFPTTPFTCQIILEVLRNKLGLKKSPSINDLYQSAQMIKTELDFKKAEKKSEGVLYWLDKDTTASSAKIGSWFGQIAFLALKSSPLYRIAEIPFYVSQETHRFISPNECVLDKDYNLISSSLPICKSKVTSPKLIKAFGWETKSIKPEKVSQHLLSLAKVKITDASERVVLQMTNDIYRWMESKWKEDATDFNYWLKNSRWIWNGKGFSSSKEMFMDCGSSNLEPYKFSIPRNLIAFSDFFEAMEVKKTPDSSDLIQLLEEIKEFHLSCKTSDQSRCQCYKRFFNTDTLAKLSCSVFPR
jgi:hypothetical protein